MVALACIASGRLTVIPDGGVARELESPYSEEVRERERRIVRKNAWKTQGTGARFMGAGRAVLWGNEDPNLSPTRFIGVSKGRTPGELMYAISTGVICGIFIRDPNAPDETRVFHDADTKLHDLDFSDRHEALAFSVMGAGGTSSLGVLADDGRGVKLVTEGDVMDRAPRWLPETEPALVYASAGIGRTEAGVYAGRGPFALHRLSLKDSNIEVIAADPKYDFFAPVALSDSEILAIRRPYRSPNAAPPVTTTIFDALLAPFRLLYAVLQMLNFFTARYAGKPLLTSGNAKQKAADAQQMMVWGNLVDVQSEANRAAQNSAGVDGAHGYELVRITKQGIVTVARSAVAFDVANDGTVYFSTGQKIMRVREGKPEPVCDLEHVTELVVYG
jgi:hypothetical protein